VTDSGCSKCAFQEVAPDAIKNLAVNAQKWQLVFRRNDGNCIPDHEQLAGIIFLNWKTAQLYLNGSQSGSTGSTNLNCASRYLLEKCARFSLQVAHIAVQRMLDGFGYGLIVLDVVDARTVTP